MNARNSPVAPTLSPVSKQKGASHEEMVFKRGLKTRGGSSEGELLQKMRGTSSISRLTPSPSVSEHTN